MSAQHKLKPTHLGSLGSKMFSSAAHQVFQNMLLKNGSPILLVSQDEGMIVGAATAAPAARPPRRKPRRVAKPDARDMNTASCCGEVDGNEDYRELNHFCTTATITPQGQPAQFHA